MKGLNEERKILLPDNLPPSPPQEPTHVNGDVKMADVDDLDPPEGGTGDSDEDAPRGRALRRGPTTAAERQRQKEREQERKEKAEAAKVPKQSKQFIKVLKDIQKKEEIIKKCEEEIAVIDNDLREADCPRTRVLGKDRFWNRYYWFERNGMPYAGLPNSSTAHAGYANGCIWVQGPDDIEREGYIDLVPEYQNEYKARFNITVPERKTREEGPTSVYNARQWGYFSDPDEVTQLIDWLDPRGFNELKLRKELVNYKAKIVKNMANRKQYLEPTAETTTVEKKDDGKRMNTRRANVSSPEPPQYRCLQWQNLTALEEIGHLHSDQPPPVKPKKAASKKKEKELKEVEVEVLPPAPKKSARQPKARGKAQ